MAIVLAFVKRSPQPEMARAVWGGTLAAFQRFARTTLPYRADGSPAGERALAGIENAVVREVAQALGNTPAVCRRSYIDPCVLAGWREGRVQRAGSQARGERQWETAALRFLKQAATHRASLGRAELKRAAKRHAPAEAPRAAPRSRAPRPSATNRRESTDRRSPVVA